MGLRRRELGRGRCNFRHGHARLRGRSIHDFFQYAVCHRTGKRRKRAYVDGMATFRFRHYRRSSAEADIGTLIGRHSCGATDLASAIARVKDNYLGAFRPETDVAELRDERGLVVWQTAIAHT